MGQDCSKIAPRWPSALPSLCLCFAFALLLLRFCFAFASFLLCFCFAFAFAFDLLLCCLCFPNGGALAIYTYGNMAHGRHCPSEERYMAIYTHGNIRHCSGKKGVLFEGSHEFWASVPSVFRRVLARQPAKKNTGVPFSLRGSRCAYLLASPQKKTRAFRFL
jgi:hypothetical protein